MCRHAPPPTSWQTCKLLTRPQVRQTYNANPALALETFLLLTSSQSQKSKEIHPVFCFLPSAYSHNNQILTLPLFRPSQKCPETGCVLPAVGACERPRQREVCQERVHLPRHPDHPRPPRHDPGVRGKLIRAKYFKPNVFGTI